MQTIVSFRHLEALRAVFLAGSVTGAAHRMSITQSAVSHLVRDAEERLGYKLFDRRLGRLVPTRRGRLLWEQIRQAFTGFEAINDFCLRLREIEARDIVVATIPIVSTAILPWVFRRYRETIGPQFFRIRPQETEIAIASVRFQTADIAFGVNLEPVPGVAGTVIADYDAMCFLPPGHPLAAKRVIEQKDLLHLPMISLSRREGIGQSVETALPDIDLAARAVVECPSAITAAAMVEAGIGYTLLDPITAFIFRGSEIVVRPFQPRIPFVIRAYWSETEDASFDRAYFVDLTKKRALAIADRKA
ncbi:MAG: LysR family transcriptional regulator [Geminicoccaceae bacterium]|nr:LysR family transcriptional regulator [Geminicoccaceae bacterium]